MRFLTRFAVLFTSLSMMSFLPAYADTSTATTTTGTTTGGATSSDSTYLQQISSNTYNILSAVNNIPTYLGDIEQMAQSWLATDSDTTSFITQSQADFASLGAAFSQNQTTQNGLQTQVMSDLTHQPLSSFTQPVNAPAILTKIPNINDIAYGSLIGVLPAPHGTSTPYNYIVNAAGLSIYHTPPSFSWAGNPTDISNYGNYFNTITSIESFNAYVLSNLAANNQNNNQITTLQTSLTNQATSSSWLAQIATEDLGKLLREILVFQSQSYVLLTQQLQVQQQMLTAQAMTNTLLILAAYQGEVQMARKAQGLPPHA